MERARPEHTLQGAAPLSSAELKGQMTVDASSQAEEEGAEAGGRETCSRPPGHAAAQPGAPCR